MSKFRLRIRYKYRKSLQLRISFNFHKRKKNNHDYIEMTIPNYLLLILRSNIKKILQLPNHKSHPVLMLSCTNKQDIIKHQRRYGC